MPTYNFTSDLRISVLSSRLETAANEIINNEYSSDKSTSNNRATLAFYFNLIDGTNTLKLAASGKITEVVRNFVIKFQYPNTYTSELYEINIKEGTLVAPLRETIKLLAYQFLAKNETLPYLTFDEIRYFIFCKPDAWINASTSTYESVLTTILDNRANNHDYSNEINRLITWKQYERQSRELISIIPYACDCFKVGGGKITLAMPNPLDEKFADALHFISSTLKQDAFWIPESNEYNSKLKESYTSFMDINGDVEFCRQSKPMNEIQRNYDKPLQVIYFGAPGTGKSHRIKQECKKHEHYRITFHPDTDYASFVGSYKPITHSEKVYTNMGDKAIALRGENGKPITTNKITYKYVYQAFLNAYIAAWKEQQNEDPKPVFLVIEEINRGNCAQIFGDIFQLLDRNDAGFSDYPIVTDNDLKKELEAEFSELSVANADAINAIYEEGDVVGKVIDGSRLLLPNNLYIWATMNTSDQSLFPIDSAFKRRWEWKYIKIADSGKGYVISVNGNEYDWWQLVSKINGIIGSEIEQEDKKLGYFFAKTSKNADGRYIISADTFLSKVIFFLYNDVFKDFGFEYDFFKDGNGEIMLFADYFNEYGDTDHDKVETFIHNLGLKPINGSPEEIVAADSTEDLTNPSDGEKFSVNGTSVRYQNNVAAEAVNVYIQQHPEKSAREVISDWRSLGQMVSHFIENESENSKRTDRDKDYIKRLECNGEAIIVSRQGWGDNRPNGYGYALLNLVNAINAKGWNIDIRGVE